MLTIYYVSAKILLLKHIETKEKTFLILTAKKDTLTAKKTNQAIVRKITKEGKEKEQKENQKINHVSQPRDVIHSCFAERGAPRPLSLISFITSSYLSTQKPCTVCVAIF